MLLLSTAGRSDQSYEDITAILASSKDTQSQDLASVCAGPAVSDLKPAETGPQHAETGPQPAETGPQPAETDVQPVWDASVTDVHTPDNFPAPLLEEGSIGQTGAGLVDDPLASENIQTSLAAAGQAAVQSGGIAHSHADPSGLCLKSHSTSCSSMSSQDSTCTHSSRQLQLSDLHEPPSPAAGQSHIAHGASQTASGLLHKGDLSMQGAQASQASPAGLSAEPGIDNMPASPTSPCAEHDSCNHQTLNPAQQTPEQHPTLPLGGAADLRQRVSMSQASTGLQTQLADSEVHRVGGSSQRPNAPVESTHSSTREWETALTAASGDATITQGETASAAACGDATPAQVS